MYVKLKFNLDHLNGARSINRISIIKNYENPLLTFTYSDLSGVKNSSTMKDRLLRISKRSWRTNGKCVCLIPTSQTITLKPTPVITTLPL